MAKIESSFKNMLLTLFIVTLLASMALGGIYNLTKGPIALARKAAKEKAIKEVIPEFDSLKTFKVLPEDAKDSIEFNLGYQGGELVGTAIASFSNNGYDPMQIRIMIGILPDHTIGNTSVIQQKETPGLGTKIKDPKFKDQFMGINPVQFNLKVKKDGGDVDAITAATISSRAFSEAVELAFKTYTKLQEEQP
ncbi:MAG: RnfABCDGE type electron transport complex subunit G [Bacteroidota bacterium]|nr:RnfABCDGE type electron transport complex subunit G [Bacteroidota bacterium]